MSQENDKITIEISVAIGDNVPEHEGYYTSAEDAKKTIDEIFGIYEKNNENDFHICLSVNGDIKPKCIFLNRDGIICENKGMCKYKC